MFHNKAIASLMLLILLSSTFIGGITFTIQKSYAQEVQQPETPAAAPPCDPNTPYSCPPPAPTENATETPTEQPAAPTEQPAAPTEQPAAPTEQPAAAPTETPTPSATSTAQPQQQSNCNPNAATVRRGSTGQEVQNLQNILLQLGYNIGGPTADGNFGPATEAAVKQFQQTSGLTADGIVGPGTWSALCSAAGGNMQAPPSAPTETPAPSENTQTNTVPSAGTLIINTGCDPSKSSCLPIDVRYDVPLVPQLTGMSCWAAGAAMLVGWRDHVSINPSEIAKGIGYWSQYNKKGLAPQDTTMFKYWGLTPEAPQSYTVEGFAHLLKDNGPLWVASAAPGPHIRVVTGMSGDGTPDGTIVYINDPWQTGMTTFSMPNSGSQYTETYHQFQDKQDSLAMTELKIPGALYVAHVNVPHLP